MNNNNKLNFDAVISSSRWKQALFKSECFPQLKKLRSALQIVANAACADEAGMPVDLSLVFSALERVNNETQTVSNMDNPLSL